VAQEKDAKWVGRSAGNSQVKSSQVAF